MDETDGMAVDLTWEGLFPVVQEQPHIMRQGNRVTLDAQRFAQLGSWEGRIVIDGEEIVVDPAVWIGSRDRSWGTRPVGERGAGAPGGGGAKAGFAVPGTGGAGVKPGGSGGLKPVRVTRCVSSMCAGT